MHKCCGTYASVKEKEDEGTCTWQWPAKKDEDCVEVPGHCCQESVVSQPGACLAEPVCQAQVMEADGQMEARPVRAVQI